jgi:hypothetical protein
MSDFLTRTSEAALGVRRVVQPLVASRYAPGPQQPVLELETFVDQAAAARSTSDAKSDELALSDPNNMPEQFPESPARTAEQTVWPETSELETALLAQSVNRRPDRVAATVSPDEYSAQVTTEQNEVSISSPADERGSSNTNVSIRPAALQLSESAGELQPDGATVAEAPRSGRAISLHVPRSIEAAGTQPAAKEAKAEPEVSQQRGSVSVTPADRFELHDSASGSRHAVVERNSEVAVREVIRDGDSAQPPSNRFNEATIVPSPHNEIGRTEPDSQLDQPLFDLRDEWKSPDNIAHRAAATRPVSQSAAISDRGVQDAAEPPVIRVSIGHIEVRAAAPPAPPVETPAPAKPKMSLNEYLRQHNGRRP